jgi:hypothetical protein
MNWNVYGQEQPWFNGRYFQRILFVRYEENYETLRYFAFRAIFGTNTFPGKADALLLKPHSTHISR